MRGNGRRPTTAAVVGLFVALVVLAAGCRAETPATGAVTTGAVTTGAVVTGRPATTATITLATTTPATTARAGLATVAIAELPPQARRTLALIDAGGPFPFPQDGTTFQNRERLLPRQPSGYYREYTVVTPGSPDRGARRIVAGRNGDRYYTDDHYASFRSVVER